MLLLLSRRVQPSKNIPFDNKNIDDKVVGEEVTSETTCSSGIIRTLRYQHIASVHVANHPWHPVDLPLISID